MQAPRPYAAFDIDGTLIRWQLYHAIADELARRGILDSIQYQAVRDARSAWKQRQHHTSFNQYEQTLINLIDAAIGGISVEDLTAASETVIKEYKDQVYIFTRDLISELRAKGYLLFIVSASQSEIVKLLAEYYEFDDYRGSDYETKDGFYTGQKLLLRSEQKPLAIEKLIVKHGARRTGSIAVGDSEGDIPLLASVERPIAFNPTQELFEHAQSEGWKIVVERKSVIYQLSPDKNGAYQLG
jgi:HAD superfamily hydrolase (TIGR01490 family)